jgi:hypothetical protein
MISDKSVRDRFGVYLQELVVDKYSKNHILKLLITKCEEIKKIKKNNLFVFNSTPYSHWNYNIYVPFTAKFTATPCFF